MDIININSVQDYAARMASKVNTDTLKNKADNAQSDEELMEACKEFENYLWEQVIKSMKETANPFKAEDDTNSQYVEVFMDTAVSDVAKSLTDQSMGPNSLAMQMYNQMKRNNTIDVETLLAQSKAASGISTEE